MLVGSDSGNFRIGIPATCVALYCRDASNTLLWEELPWEFASNFIYSSGLGSKLLPVARPLVSLTLPALPGIRTTDPRRPTMAGPKGRSLGQSVRDTPGRKAIPRTTSPSIYTSDFSYCCEKMGVQGKEKLTFRPLSLAMPRLCLMPTMAAVTKFNV